MYDDINAEYEDKRDMTGKEYVYKNFAKEEIIKKMCIDSCVSRFGIETELSNSICSGNCEECWNSKVENLMR